jgi:SAM-dependent methyltransferase
MQINYQFRQTSLLSGGPTTEIINLGNHGFADSFFPSEEYERAASSFPLICNLDTSSGLVQVANLSIAKERYGDVDYSYTSSNSSVATTHWKNLVSYLSGLINLNYARVLEIGSNDGYLLSLINEHTSNIVGVDASEFMAHKSNNNGIPTICGIFGEDETVKSKIMQKFSAFDLILANNVVNHSNTPIAFLENIAELLTENGLFVFEVPYWLETIRSYRFDQIYHEHITYLTIESSQALLRQAGLKIIDVKVVDYHGGSLRVVASKNGTMSKGAESLQTAELQFDLKDLQTYKNYMLEIEKRRSQFLEELDIKAGGVESVVFGIGAAAKANTFLTYYGLDNKRLKFILDSSEFKQGKLTPVTRIPITSDEMVSEIDSGLGIVLAWNISGKLKDQLLELNPKLIFLDTSNVNLPLANDS